MAMTSADSRRSRWAGLGFGQLLALLFLAACAWWVARELELILPSHRILVSLGFQEQLGSALAWQLAHFVGAWRGSCTRCWAPAPSSWPG